jgi:hypothetical protein
VSGGHVSDISDDNNNNNNNDDEGEDYNNTTTKITTTIIKTTTSSRKLPIDMKPVSVYRTVRNFPPLVVFIAIAIDTFYCFSSHLFMFSIETAAHLHRLMNFLVFARKQILF